MWFDLLFEVIGVKIQKSTFGLTIYTLGKLSQLSEIYRSRPTVYLRVACDKKQATKVAEITSKLMLPLRS